MYGSQSWTIKKAESWRTDFELWCWRRLLKVPWTARRSNQSVLKKINPEYLLEELMLKLKLQYLGHHAKSWFIGKDSDARKEWGQEKGAAEDDMVSWHHQLHGDEFEQIPGGGGWQRSLVCYNPWGCRVRQDLATEQQQQPSWVLASWPVKWAK